MSNLGPQYINQTFGYLLQVPGGLTSTITQITDGAGNSSGLYMDNAGNVQVNNLNVTGSTIAANGFYLPSANQLGFSIGSSEQMRLTSTGLGIGTSSPGAKLDVKSQINVTNSASSSMLLAKATYFGYSSSYGVTQIGASSGNFSTVAIGYDPSINLNSDFSGNGSEVVFRNGAVFITPNSTDNGWYKTLYLKDGNLGLGVTPSAWNSAYKAFDINSASSVAAYSSGMSVFQNAYWNGSNFIYKTSAAASAMSLDSGSVYWRVAPSGTAGAAISFTQAMTLDSSGNLLVGDTSAYLTTAKLLAKTTTSGNSGATIVTAYSGDVSYPAVTIGKNDNNTTTSQLFVKFYQNVNVGSGQINANGASAAAFGSFSDARLKENITALSNQLDNICALKPSEFDYKDGSGHQIGFIAQEMQEVYPDVVGEGEDGMLTITGWSKTEARLVKAIQELKAELDELKSTIGK